MKIKLTELVEDFDLYPRNDVSSQHVTALCDAAAMGDPIPPIVVDRKTKRIVDGFHRYRMAKRLGWEEIDCALRDYKTEAELFADAVRLNRTHGRAFDPYDTKRSIERLMRYGLDSHAIGEIVRIPAVRVEDLVRGFAISQGNAVPLKGGLSHFAGRKITKAQRETNESYSGMEGTFHARQLVRLIETEMWKDTPAFRDAMDSLVALWTKAKRKVS